MQEISFRMLKSNFKILEPVGTDPESAKTQFLNTKIAQSRNSFASAWTEVA